MLEKVPRAVGEVLSGLKAGLEKTVYRTAFADVPEALTLTSPAFADGGELPTRFTADGAGISPPLAWSGEPAGTAALAILVEDAGSPTPRPLVHLIAWNLAAGAGCLDEAALAGPGHDAPGHDLGRNSFLKAAWLPPDPPTGHGAHAYLFQVYALDQVLAFAEPPGRDALVAAMRGHVVARGRLVGLYRRG